MYYVNQEFICTQKHCRWRKEAEQWNEYSFLKDQANLLFVRATKYLREQGVSCTGKAIDICIYGNIYDLFIVNRKWVINTDKFGWNEASRFYRGSEWSGIKFVGSN